MTDPTTYRLGNVYADDALSRDLDIGLVTRRTKTVTVLTMTADQHAEALADARYYSLPYGPGADLPDLRAAARRAVKALETRR